MTTRRARRTPKNTQKQTDTQPNFLFPYLSVEMTNNLHLKKKLLFYPAGVSTKKFLIVFKKNKVLYFKDSIFISIWHGLTIKRHKYFRLEQILMQTCQHQSILWRRNCGPITDQYVTSRVFKFYLNKYIYPRVDSLIKTPSLRKHFP